MVTVTAMTMICDCCYLRITKDSEDIQWFLSVRFWSAYEDFAAGDDSENGIVLWLGVWVKFDVVHGSCAVLEKKI